MTVTVYTKPACPQCITTKRWLAKYSIDHLTVDIVDTPAALDLIVDDLGYLAAPVVTITNDEGRLVDHWSGFQPGRLAGLLDEEDAA